MILDELQQKREYVLYGAQVIAVGAREAIKHLTGMEPICFAVGNSKSKASYPTGNPAVIDGVPVRAIEDVSKDTFIIVAVTELIQKEVLPFLEENGYWNVYPLTQHEEHLLMSAYYNSIGRFPGVSTPIADHDALEVKVSDFVLYEVKNDRDKPLDYHPERQAYERSIQAGAVLADRKIAELTDDTGDNISDKNRMYCEMSAVYWIWKNTDHEWVGIEHYRRHLLVSPDMLTDEVDVIMPLPYICYPNEVAQFLRFTTEAVLNVLLKALKDLHPDKFEDYYRILYGKYQYTYNLICARREIYDDYCKWFFEITMYMESMADKVPEIKETRALSYVAEVLTNLYFMYHQNDLSIRHVEKGIYV